MRYLTIPLFILSTLQLYAEQDAKLEENVLVELHNGSVISAKTKFVTVKVLTKHGVLNVPVQDIRNITLGYYCEPKLFKQLSEAVTNLEHVQYIEREKARKYLELNPEYAYNLLAKAKFKDAEGPKRVELLMEYYKEKYIVEQLVKPEIDTMILTDGSIYNGIINETWAFQTASIGEFVAPNYSLKHLAFNAKKFFKLVYSPQIQWVDTGIDVSGRFKVDVFGEIDISTESLKRTAKPSGYDGTLGVDNFSPAMSVKAKIGEDGESFLMGAGGVYRTDKVQRLYVLIVPFFNSDAYMGYYTVTVQ